MSSSNQVSMSAEQYEALQGVLKQADSLVASVIGGKPNNFRDALELAKAMSLLKKQHGISSGS